MKKSVSQFITQDTLGSSLLILFGFSLPLSVALNNLIAILLVLLWLYQKKYRITWQIVKTTPFLMAVLCFFLLHITGLLWTDDLAWGIHIARKEWAFLLIPMMMVFIKRAHMKYYIGAFLLSMSISEVLSYLIWFDIIPVFQSATLQDPTPFMSHISYNPFLAFAIYLMGYYILFDKDISKLQKIVYTFFSITMSINMFITGGRAGQIAYLLVVTILVFQYLRKYIFRAMIVTIVVLGSILFVAYHNSVIFQKRINEGISEIKSFDNKSAGNIGIRLNWAINTLILIRENPVIGLGTGDFKEEYKKLSLERTPHLLLTVQPHNMYLLVMAQFGILGLISLLMILFTQISFARQSKDRFVRSMGVTLPVIFFFIMFSDSYLLGHFTTMLFVYFSAILYRPYDENYQ